MPDGRPYFEDHNTKNTYWDLPPEISLAIESGPVGEAIGQPAPAPVAPPAGGPTGLPKGRPRGPTTNVAHTAAQQETSRVLAAVRSAWWQPPPHTEAQPFLLRQPFLCGRL